MSGPAGRRRAPGGCGTPALEAEGIAFGWEGGSGLFTDVALTVTAGEVVALTGPSGTGKSTLLHVLVGLLSPTAGGVRLHGKPLPRAPRDRSRLRLEQMGFVFQGGELLPELTVAENVELPLRALGVAPAAARQRSLVVLASLGLSGLSDVRLGHTSGGEAQRAAVARAVVHRPGLVIADEPTGSVDEANTGLVFDALTASVSAYGGAVLVATHDLALASRADRILVLEERSLHAPAAHVP